MSSTFMSVHGQWNEVLPAKFKPEESSKSTSNIPTFFLMESEAVPFILQVTCGLRALHSSK